MTTTQNETINYRYNGILASHNDVIHVYVVKFDLLDWCEYIRSVGLQFLDLQYCIAVNRCDPRERVV